jgi:uncharacterized protein (TIGR01244 family)
MFQPVTHSLAVGNIHSLEELQQISEKGYKVVIDLCTEAEGNLLDEQELQNIGFNYINLPVSIKTLTPETLQTFMATVNDHEHPIYVRCASGLRASVMTLLNLAKKENWDEEKYLGEFAKLGLDLHPDHPLCKFSQECLSDTNN